MIRRNDRTGWMIRMYCVTESCLQTIVNAGTSEFSVWNTRWSCAHTAGSSHTHTRTHTHTHTRTHTLTDMVPWPPSAAPHRPEHKKHFSCRPLCTTTLLLSVPLFPFRMLLYWGTNNWTKWRKVKKHTWLHAFHVSDSGVGLFFAFLQHLYFLHVFQRTRGLRGHEAHYSLKQKDCGGINPTLSIVWQ